MQEQAPIQAWYFSRSDVLPNGDGRKIVVGETLTVEGDIIPCRRGLHASPTAFDALQYAPGPLLWRVELSGIVVPHGNPVDKYAASARKTLTAAVDATDTLRAFARACALDVIHLWDAPQVVRYYLTTGDESMRAAARAAAGDVAWAARAARDAAGARAAAARAAARAAAWAAARDAAGDVAWAAAWAAQATRFNALVASLVAA